MPEWQLPASYFLGGGGPTYSGLQWSAQFNIVGAMYGTAAAMAAYNTGYSAGPGRGFGSGMGRYISGVYLKSYQSQKDRPRGSGLIGFTERQEGDKYSFYLSVGVLTNRNSSLKNKVA